MLSITFSVKRANRSLLPHILQVGSYPEWDETPLNRGFTMHRYFAADDKPAFLTQVGPLIRGIATRGDLGASRAMIDACPHLEIVSVYGVGTDAVDLAACRARGIRVTNTPDVLTEDCADLGVAMMLAASRGLVSADAWVRRGHWAGKGQFPLRRRISGCRAGILGLGRIGFAIAERLRGFGMTISYSATAPKPHAEGLTFVADPLELARGCDVLFVTLAASAATRHIVDRRVIEALGPEGLLVNISRASNLDEPALLDALESGSLGAAALDVFEGEPALDPRFLALDNVLLQPHHASGTVEARRAMGQLVRDNLKAHFAGRPLLTAVL